MDWTLVAEAVRELIELSDTERYEGRSKFRLDRLTVEPDPAHPHGETLKVSLFDSDDKSYEYAIYVSRRGTTTDGY